MYDSLDSILKRAYDQAAHGKGAERHACGRPFEEQPMQTISALLGTHNGLLYQAMKKIQESNRLDRDAAVRELLGAINYIAGAIIYIEKQEPPQQRDILEPPPQRGLLDTHWFCNHGDVDVLPIEVPLGDACPVCFSTR